MSASKLRRRALLTGLGGITIGLPFLEALAPRRASADVIKPPKRLVIVYTSNGTVMRDWKPSAVGADFPISKILTPFDTPLLRPHLSVVSGVSMESAKALPGNGHALGMTNLLTGRPFTEIQGTEFGDVGWGAGISIDQAIAERVKADGQLPSIQLGVQSQKQYQNFYCYISYGEGGGSGNAIPSDDDPRSAFQRLFGNLPDGEVTQAELEKVVARRRGVLDFVKEDFSRLQGKLGSADQQRLDKHMTLVAELEERIDVGFGCIKPPGPTFGDDEINKVERFPDIGRAQMDLLAVALGCDLTRVATLQWSTAQSGTVFESFVDADWSDVENNKYHHGISHQATASDNGSPAPAELAAMSKLTLINTWFAEQVAYLGTKLAGMEEADGTSVLDNTAILWVSEVSEGPSHKFTDMPYVLLGGMGGALKTNQHFDFDNGRTHNDLFVTLAQAMGVSDMTTFGDPEFCTGPIDALLV